MAITYVDQVIVPEINVGGTKYVYGELLPAATTTAAVQLRHILHTTGSTRAVSAAGSASTEVGTVGVVFGARAQAREGAAWSLSVPKPVLISPDGVCVANY